MDMAQGCFHAPFCFHPILNHHKPMTNTRTLLCAAILAATSAAASAGDTFTNPVIRRSAPDPTVIRADDGHFYLYSTEDTPNTPIYRSDNLVDWTLIGTAFSDTSRPSWNPKGGIWAPDINKIGDKYVLYYSKSEWMGLKDAGVGVATADRPEAAFHRPRLHRELPQHGRMVQHRPLLHRGRGTQIPHLGQLLGHVRHRTHRRRTQREARSTESAHSKQLHGRLLRVQARTLLLPLRLQRLVLRGCQQHLPHRLLTLRERAGPTIPRKAYAPATADSAKCSTATTS